MFIKGSRYNRLSDIKAVSADGTRALSKTLRIIPDTAGTFLHTVCETDRLDLLAYRYYKDPRKWWLICDANPGYPLPVDMLKQAGRKIVIPPDRVV